MIQLLIFQNVTRIKPHANTEGNNVLVNGMDLYLYSASSLDDHSKLFKVQSLTHSYSASISSTLLFYEAQFGVQHLAQGTLRHADFFGKTGDWTADLQIQLGGQPLYPPSATADSKF